jgi:predicted NAD-dependent protein-ADP-ribosyltransferase YbiA (DUF1768 family)
METNLKITYHGNVFVAVDYWWEGGNFVFQTKDGHEYCFTNVYPVSIKFEGLDYSTSDECTFVYSSVKYEKKSNV